MGYVFYDTETSGLNRQFDQIIQFAAIITDEHFDPKKRFDLKLRLSPYVVPSPMALNVNGTPLANCYDPSRVSQLEGMKIIHDFINQHSPATFAGWNSIGFDEEILRHSFYRQLLGPFPTSMNNNARMDVMTIARAIDILQPGSFTVPKGMDGEKSFKLQNICTANGYSPRRAHEGLSDVEACIFVARLLREAAPEIWSSFAQTSRKHSAMDIIQRGQPCVFVSGWKEKTRAFVGVAIGKDLEIDAYSYVADLAAPLADFQSIESEAITEWFNQSPPPIERIKCNASPLAIPIDDLAEYDDTADILEDKAQAILENEHLCNALCSSFSRHIAHEFPDEYIEQKLYGGGWPTNDLNNQLRRFHNASWPDRLDIARTLPDIRYRKFAMRSIGENAYRLFNDTERAQYDMFITRRYRPDQPDVPWQTLSNIREKIAELPIGDQPSMQQQYESYFGI